ncbi:hypothetical protein GW17_00052822 [Ensete ventricosum]|nr:hypothetical protein GW17_00052822 [Ensete ventricosum]
MRTRYLGRKLGFWDGGRGSSCRECSNWKPVANVLGFTTAAVAGKEMQTVAWQRTEATATEREEKEGEGKKGRREGEEGSEGATPLCIRTRRYIGGGEIKEKKGGSEEEEKGLRLRLWLEEKETRGIGEEEGAAARREEEEEEEGKEREEEERKEATVRCCYTSVSCMRK